MARMVGSRRFGIHASLIGLLGCDVPPAATESSSTDGTSTDGTSTGDAEPDLPSEACSPQSTVEIELSADFPPESVAFSPCVVSFVEQDPQDPRRWNFAAECAAVLVELVLTLDPPLEAAPFEV